MTSTAGLWPWFAFAGLGVYHGINPAMGWLFAVALGLHRKNQRIVLLSLIPIALGHAVSVAVVLAVFLSAGLVVDHVVLTRFAAAVLIAWALWHLFNGHRQRPLVGMQTGLLGLGVWSFLMASVHGAGLMLVPALLPLCISAAPGSGLLSNVSLPLALAALAVHTAAMLATIAIISIIVYKWIGLGFLRRGWINLDLVWVGALLACGLIMFIW
jgi:hypothetical protein